MIHSTSSQDAQQGSWFVVWTESRAEKKVVERISALGLTSWLPTVTERHRWSDRWRNLVCPLFPGYLFARQHSVAWNEVLRTPGVLSIVKREGRPAMLTDAFVSRLRDALEREGVVPEAVSEPTDYQRDDEVIVQEGVLKGVRGVIRERRNGTQLVIWVSEIGRGVAFTIDSARVKSAV